ncbi:MAG: hypothetical protein ACLFPE_05275 [Bacteroidales bacterium]
MDEIKTILMYTLPVILFALFFILIIWYLVSLYHRRIRKEDARENKRATLNLRLQAYERLMLFLERIDPIQLTARIQPDDIPAEQYRRVLLENIREEFDHNITQQLYVSQTLWGQIKSAKESVVGLVNAAAGELDRQAPALELAAAILKRRSANEQGLVEPAIRHLKKEVAELF